MIEINGVEKRYVDIGSKRERHLSAHLSGKSRILRSEASSTDYFVRPSVRPISYLEALNCLKQKNTFKNYIKIQLKRLKGIEN